MTGVAGSPPAPVAANGTPKVSLATSWMIGVQKFLSAEVVVVELKRMRQPSGAAGSAGNPGAPPPAIWHFSVVGESGATGL